MKLAPFASLLAFALCTSCVTTPPGGTPAAKPAAAPSTETLTRAQQMAKQGAASLDAKDFVTAQQTAGTAAALDPQYEEAWIVYGMASLRLDQPDKARQAYEHAHAAHQVRLSQGPADAGKVYQEIFLLSLLGRPAEATALLKRALDQFPNDQQISNLSALYPEIKKTWDSWAVKSP